MAVCFAIDAQSALIKELKNQRIAEEPYTDKRMRIETRFGQRVRMYRKQRHLTQDQLANKCGLNQNYVSDIETGKRNVTLRVIDNIAKALGVQVEDLVR